jgi:hypothetical protein
MIASFTWDCLDEPSFTDIRAGLCVGWRCGHGGVMIRSSGVIIEEMDVELYWK